MNDLNDCTCLTRQYCNRCTEDRLRRGDDIVDSLKSFVAGIAAATLVWIVVLGAG